MANLMKENPRLQAAFLDLKKAGYTANDIISRALQDSEILKAISLYSNAVALYADRASAPLRDTEAYKQIAASFEEAFDDAGGNALRYGGYTEKEDRRRRREIRRAKAGKASKRVAANPE
jgi:import inner membrane translocase subunit TIM44